MDLIQFKRATIVSTACFLVATMYSPIVNAMDLQEAYKLAQQNDFAIKSAQYDHDSAIERLPLARSAFRPRVNATLEYSINDQNDDGFGNFNTRTLSLSINQSLFNRENRAIINQAELGVQQAEAQLLAEQQNLILRTARAYFDVLRTQVEVEFSQSELEAIARQKEQAERRFEVGLVPVTDVRTAQAQYDLAIAAEIAAKNAFENARGALQVITGVTPDSIAQLAVDLPLVAPDPANMDEWEELALQQNFDLQAARLAARTASAVVASARGSRYPTLGVALVGQMLEHENDSAASPRDLEAGVLRFEVSMPLYSGGRISSQIRQAEADAASANQRLLSQERETAKQVQNVYRGVTGSIARANALHQALSSTRKSADATDAGFRAGTRTSVEVLQSLRDVFGAESDYAAARYDYIINYLSLKAASGTLREQDLMPINNFLAKQGS